MARATAKPVRAAAGMAWACHLGRGTLQSLCKLFPRMRYGFASSASFTLTFLRKAQAILPGRSDVILRLPLVTMCLDWAGGVTTCQSLLVHNDKSDCGTAIHNKENPGLVWSRS